MKKLNIFGLTLVATLLPLIASGQTFSNFVTLGDSLTAGYQSGSLYEGAQKNAYGAILAKQFGSSGFAQSTVTEPGIPAKFTLLSLSPTTIAPADGLGSPSNLQHPAPFNNLGIPGAKTHDLVATKTVCGFNPLDPACPNPYYDFVLRGFADPAHATTALEQAIGLQPTFGVIWIGNNDVLGAATSGAAVDGITLTSAEAVEADLRLMLGALSTNTSASWALVNLPDVNALPFVNAIPPFIVDPVTRQPVLHPATGELIPLLGLKQGDAAPSPLPPGTKVTLGASSLLALGIGIPAELGGTGLPLPDGGIVNGEFQPGVLLYNDELAAISNRTNEINSRIAALGAEFGIPVVDANGVFNDIVSHGAVYGGLEFTADFLTGGIFSYDGVHPSSLGYAIAANEIIKVVNSHYGTTVPQANLFPFIFGDGLGKTWDQASTADGFVYGDEALEQIRGIFPPNLSALDDDGEPTSPAPEVEDIARPR